MSPATTAQAITVAGGAGAAGAPAASAGRRLGRAIGDSLAMAGRNVRRLRRTPDQIVFTLISPIMFTLLFRYVFGGAIKGLGPINYVNYLIPGIAVQTAMFTSGNTGFALAEDRGSGFLDRLRSLPMARIAVLAGQVAADTVRNAAALVIIVVVGVAVGFRPHSVGGLLGGFAVLLAFTLATSFIFAFMGLFASNAQAVNAATFPVIFPLTFASSAFVPTSTMPSWLRGFANHQPVTTVIDTVRDLALGSVTRPQRAALFAGQSTTSLVVQSLVWTGAIGLVFGFLAVRRYNSTTA